LRQFELALPIKLAGLWTAAMFCYVYGDMISMYLPGRLEAMAGGDLGPLGTATPALLVGIAFSMSVPAVMIALSLLLPAKPTRVLNLIFGVLYSLMMAATMATAPAYYLYLGVVEILLTGTIVWLAWKWPRAAATE
jgi:hypothetical protein